MDDFQEFAMTSAFRCADCGSGGVFS